MSLDEEVWTQRLEKSAIAATVLSLFANVGINSGYNTSVCLFAVYSAYARNGRVNAVSAAMMLTSILIDVTLYGRFMFTRTTQSHQTLVLRASLK
jgi:multisubunit Na+/H+ antiporter MnhC subunit